MTSPRSSAADLALRAALRPAPGVTVLTGGQTGVDTLAACAALGAGLPVHMVFPRGFRQEDGPLTPARRAELRGAVLHQLASTGFAQRTWTCVSLADAVLLVDPAGGEGCQETVRAADRLRAPAARPDDSPHAVWGRPIGERWRRRFGCRVIPSR